MRPGLICVLLLFLVLLLAPAQHADSSSATDWDPRLDPLNVTLSPALDCTSGCWRLVSAQYQDEQESAGLHHAWARLLDEQGNELGGHPWRLTWPGGEQQLVTKAPGEWADAPLWNCYRSNEGPGAYTAYAGAERGRSDAVVGMGLPYCLHVSFRLTWQWTQTPIPTPTALPEPTPDLPFKWYLPLTAH